MKRRMTRLAWWGAGFAILSLIGCVVIVWNASTELVSPARRALQDYHREWLDRPFEHGMTIKRFSALNGQAPCLLALPDAAAGLSKRGEKVRRQLQASGVELAPFGTVFGNIVLLHGRNGRKEDLLPVAERFCAVGFRCVIPDLPARGDSPLQRVRFGETNFEASFPGEVLKEAVSRFGFPSENSGLWGMSMGGAFLARAASQPDAPWKALVVVCSFDALDVVVRQKVASYAGVAAPLLTRVIAEICVVRGGVNLSTVRPAEWAAKVTTPVFIAHGEKDALITPSQGRRLYEAYGSSDKMWTVVIGGDHDRVLVTEHPLYAEMSAWYLKYLRPTK